MKQKKQKTLLEILVTDDDKDIISEILQSSADENAMRIDGFDSCIIGTDNDGRLVYDVNSMISFCMKEQNINYLDAVEYLEFNVFCIGVSDLLSPIFVKLYDDEQKQLLSCKD